MMKEKKNKDTLTREELDLKLGTPEQVIFEQLRKVTLVEIEGEEKALIANRAILEMCDSKIATEKAKFKYK